MSAVRAGQIRIVHRLVKWCVLAHGSIVYQLVPVAEGGK